MLEKFESAESKNFGLGPHLLNIFPSRTQLIYLKLIAVPWCEKSGS